MEKEPFNLPSADLEPTHERQPRTIEVTNFTAEELETLLKALDVAAEWSGDPDSPSERDGLLSERLYDAICRGIAALPDASLERAVEAFFVLTASDSGSARSEGLERLALPLLSRLDSDPDMRQRVAERCVALFADEDEAVDMAVYKAFYKELPDDKSIDPATAEYILSRRPVGE